MNIYDYIKNNDLLLNEINTLDALIFTRLSYIHFEKVLDKIPITIKELSKYLDKIHPNRQDKKLIKLLTNSKRFKNIIVTRCEYISDKETEEEFAAITISLKDNIKFIAFRGTTKKIYDFKEDINMSFKIVPSCMAAANYVNQEIRYKKLYLGGHSKGGHLAIFSAAHIGYFKQRKIINIYNFDGPGFLEIDKSFNNINNKILNFCPENSIVGRIMTNPSSIIVVKTLKQGIEAHNLYNWQVENNDLVFGEFNTNSNEFHRRCLHILKVIPREKREVIINYSFELILKGEIKNIKEIDLTRIKRIINDTPHLLKEEKSELFSFFKILVKCVVPNPIKKINKNSVNRIKKQNNIVLDK